MTKQPQETIRYKRARFKTSLPAGRLYSASHFWMEEQEEAGVWRVGFTKFATRMLGDMVDHDFEAQPGMAIKPGQILGWVEGFKAISDVYGFCTGEFIGVNPALQLPRWLVKLARELAPRRYKRIQATKRFQANRGATPCHPLQQS